MDGCAGSRYPFLTSKERDIETGLDYFLVRYYSSTQGRFISPDEFKGGPEELFGEVDPHHPLFYADIAEPQSLNKYHYCLNNPLRYIDPDGHQTTVADRIRNAATSAAQTLVTTVNGAANAFNEDNFLPGNDGPQNSAGRFIGHAAALVQSGTEIIGGANIAVGGGAEAIATAPAVVTGFGAAAPAVGVVAAVGGVVTAAHGGAVGINTINNIFRGKKDGGRFTEPNPAPTGTLIKKDGVTVSRYPGDHGPPHAHVNGGGPSTRIGQNGKPLRNNKELSARQRAVIQENIRVVRRALQQAMKEYNYNRR